MLAFRASSLLFISSPRSRKGGGREGEGAKGIQEPGDAHRPGPDVCAAAPGQGPGQGGSGPGGVCLLQGSVQAGSHGWGPDPSPRTTSGNGTYSRASRGAVAPTETDRIPEPPASERPERAAGAQALRGEAESERRRRELTAREAVGKALYSAHLGCLQITIGT